MIIKKQRKYRLEKKVRGDWWYVLDFDSIAPMVHMAFICGKQKEVEDVRVIINREVENNDRTDECNNRNRGKT